VNVTPNYAPAITATHGAGALLWDAAGKRYLDFATGIGVNALGHCHPRVVAAIVAQAQRLAHTSNLVGHRGYTDLCARLCELTFGEQVFLQNSGTEAVEAALKLARRATGKPRFVATHGAFHGRTLGALSVTGQASYREGFGPFLDEVTFVPFNDSTLSLGPDVAAFVVEPIQGNGGVVLPEPGYLRAVRAACDRSGALLIVDEVQTGLGRTGSWFAYEQEGVVPDILALAKALGGGLPLGALVTRADVGRAFAAGSHGTTFGGNAIACAAGLATLDVLRDEGLPERARVLGGEFLRRFPRARGRGLMLGLDTPGRAKTLLQACRERGLLVTACGNDVIRLLPPLNIPNDLFAEGMAILGEVL
jgi:acetylornithine/succinyldiaminopimelate/putrescine aminotransferase